MRTQKSSKVWLPVGNGFGPAGVFSDVLYRGAVIEDGLQSRTPASQRKPCMCAERTGSPSESSESGETHQIREPTI
jgi:hypothetical protein